MDGGAASFCPLTVKSNGCCTLAPVNNVAGPLPISLLCLPWHRANVSLPCFPAAPQLLHAPAANRYDSRVLTSRQKEGEQPAHLQDSGHTQNVNTKWPHTKHTRTHTNTRTRTQTRTLAHTRTRKPLTRGPCNEAREHTPASMAAAGICKKPRATAVQKNRCQFL